MNCEHCNGTGSVYSFRPDGHWEPCGVCEGSGETPKHEYWAYQHVNGNISLKRYWSEESMADARLSPFVQSVMGRFEAATRVEAEQKARDYFGK